MLLIQTGKNTVHQNISGVGLFSFPSSEPVEIEDRHIAGVLLQQLAWSGLTEVPQTRVNGLPHYDLESAKREATAKRKAARKARVEQYIQHQLETRVRQNLPPLPPAPAILEIIEEDGWDLEAYGIHPVGWKKPEADQRLVELEASNEELRKANQALEEKNRLILERMDILMAKLEEGGKRGK